VTAPAPKLHWAGSLTRRKVTPSGRKSVTLTGPADDVPTFVTSIV
jgi:hypothetical protein